jgi:hypothetical protein
VSWIVLATAVLGFLAALLAFMQARQNKRGIAEVHILVNGRVAQLIRALRAAGIDIPDPPA